MKNIPYAYPLLPALEDYVSEIRGIWERRYLTNNGPKLCEFEKALAGYLKEENVACFVNGHLSLDCALKALALKGEVITTPFTFASTVQSIIANGLKPVFCDIEPDTYNIGPAKIEPLINENTSAIMAVHVFGRPCDVDTLEKIAKKHNLKLIYDAAHAFGAEYKGRALSGYGDISMLSFHATKVFNTIEGGALVCRDASLPDRLKSIANFGLSRGEMEYPGTNAKMNEFQACMGLLNLKIVEVEIENRRRIYDLYNERLKGIDGISIPAPAASGERCNFSYYPILIDKKRYGLDSGEMFDRFAKRGVVSRRYFYPACNEMPLMQRLGYDNATPVASYVAQNILTLPIYGKLTLEDAHYICDIIEGKPQ